MAGGKEVKTKINSVENTQKITRAMEMVAASKMRRAQERVGASRPYAAKIRRAIGHLAHANPDYEHPFMVEREVKRVGMIIISTDRGLCGGLNINLFRKVVNEMRRFEEQGVEVDLAVIGRKGQTFFRRLTEIRGGSDSLGDTPRLEDLIGSVRVMLGAFRDGEIDQLFLMGNEFVNTMTQRPSMQQLLPVVAGEAEDLPDHWDYIYEPSAAELLDDFLSRYVEAQVYQGAVENVACEM